MLDERPIHERAADPDAIECDLLYLLAPQPGRLQPIWSAEHLGRELELPPVAVVQMLADMHEAGLIHRTGHGDVFAGHAAHDLAWGMLGAE
jgi:DNA-binding IclR family transcriptional regulator